MDCKWINLRTVVFENDDHHVQFYLAQGNQQ